LPGATKTFKMIQFSDIKKGVILANTYDKGKTVTFFRMGKRTQTGFEMFDFEYSENNVIALNATVNGGFYHSNWFTIENKPELFTTFKN